MRNIWNKKFLATTGAVALIFILSLGLINYSYRSESAVANAIETTRHYVDALDGEIEDTTNPDISIPDITEANAETNPDDSSDPEAAVTTRTGPDRLVIDKLGINAYVQHVGIARSGNMAVPTNFKDVGWYKHGAAPSENGTTVIAGHLDNAVGLPGVFKNLGNLSAGDLITVKEADGSIHKYKVSSKKSYNYNENPPEVFSKTGPNRLVLITCSGSWISSERSYDTRLVVFADLVE